MQYWINFTDAPCQSSPCCVVLYCSRSIKCGYNNFGYYSSKMKPLISSATAIGLILGLVFGLLIVPIIIGVTVHVLRKRAARAAATDKISAVVTVMPGAVTPGAWPSQPNTPSAYPQPPNAYPQPPAYPQPSAAYPHSAAYPPPPPPPMPLSPPHVVQPASGW